MIHGSIYLAGAAKGGISAVVTAVRDLGATLLGTDECVRVRIADALATGWLDYATHIDVSDGAGFTARITCNECCGINASWQDGSETQVAALVEKIAAIGELDFAVAVAGELNLDATTGDEYRRVAIARTPPEAYRRQGPVGCGDRTWIGARIVGLLSDPMRVSHERRLVVGPNHRDVVQATFANDGVFARIQMRGRFPTEVPGSRWQPPPIVAPAKHLTAEAARVVAQLQESGDNEVTLEDIEATDLVAPFASLHRFRAAKFEAEGAVLAFAHLDDSQLGDSGLVGADLRGACARGARWVEVSLVDADLRWADFSGGELPLVMLDNANCAGASFRNAKFEKPSFDGAKLQGAIFDGADLTRAHFVNADLTNASFMGAKLDGLVLTGCVLTGTGLKGD
jgi:uncharacterized protein YjbI with pentapeptide repeats